MSYLLKAMLKKIFRNKNESFSKLEENKFFFNDWAKTYDCTFGKYFLRKAQRDSIEIISKNNFSALDVSCGTGEGLLILRKKTNGKIAGVDLSEEMLKIAKQKFSGKNIELKKASVDDIPYKDESFDVVLSTEAFHHYPNPENAVKEMIRVLKKGGELIITDPDFFIFNK